MSFFSFFFFPFFKLCDQNSLVFESADKNQLLNSGWISWLPASFLWRSQCCALQVHNQQSSLWDNPTPRFHSSSPPSIVMTTAVPPTPPPISTLPCPFVCACACCRFSHPLVPAVSQLRTRWLTNWSALRAVHVHFQYNSQWTHCPWATCQHKPNAALYCSSAHVAPCLYSHSLSESSNGFGTCRDKTPWTTQESCKFSFVFFRAFKGLFCVAF